MKKLVIILGIIAFIIIASLSAIVYFGSREVEEDIWLVKTSKDKCMISVEITSWDDFGFDGVVYEGNDILKKGDNIKIELSKGVNVVDKSGKVFIYDFYEGTDRGNALECPIDEGSIMYIEYKSWHDMSVGSKNLVYADYVEEKSTQ